jgi:hypothetical protein
MTQEHVREVAERKRKLEAMVIHRKLSLMWLKITTHRRFKGLRADGEKALTMAELADLLDGDASADESKRELTDGELRSAVEKTFNGGKLN